MGKIFIGDVFEIETELGLSYGQLTHRHLTHADVLRIFKPKFTSRPTDISSLANEEVEFTVLCAVGAGFKAGVLPCVGTAPVRDDLSQFPKFRSGNRSPQAPNNDDWWIWDGVNEDRVGSLSEEEMKYPRKAILNIAAIKEQIEGRVHPSLL